MNLSVDPQAPVPIYAQVVEQLTHQILSGQLPAGAPLPSVRQLGERLEVNSLTVQKAYKLLETKDLIVIKRGVGAFVRDDIHTLTDHQRTKMLRQQLEPVVRQATELDISRKDFDSLVNTLWKKG